MSEKQISLYFKQGSSDKEYHVQIEESGDAYVVQFQYGRRGSTLTAGTKTLSPVGRGEAEKIFDALVKKQKGKGYTEGAAGTPYIGGPNEERITAWQVQLLNPVNEATFDELLEDDNYVLQEKLDGKRMVLDYTKGEVTASNRQGLVCGVPEMIANDLKLVAEKVGANVLVIDGECIGNTFVAFDLLAQRDADYRQMRYETRFVALADTFTRGWGPDLFIQLVRSASGYKAKLELFNAIQQEGGEGVVLKHVSAAYTPGRPNSGGTQFKYKFVADATVEVMAVKTDRRAVNIAVRSGKVLQQVGSVTIPPNHEVPDVGDLVEVRYLYAYRDGALYQPVYKGVRNDKKKADVYDSLKFKGEAVEAVA